MSALLIVLFVFLLGSFVLIWRKEETSNQAVRRFINLLAVASTGLFVAGLALLLPFSAYAGAENPARRMLAGLFSDLTPAEIFLGTVTLSLLVISALTVTLMLAEGANDRYDGIVSEPSGREHLPSWSSNFLRVLNDRWWALPATSFGLCLPWFAVVILERAKAWGPSLLAALGGFALATALHWALRTWASGFKHSVSPFIARSLGAEYLLEKNSEGREHVKPNHFYAAMSVTFLVALFLLGTLLPVKAAAPAVTFLFVLLTFAVWILGWLEFHFPTFNIPSLVVLTALMIFFSTLFNKVFDKGYYTFDVRQTTFEPVYAPDIAKGPNLVVIDISGGGILSAAWSTYALDNLLQERPRLKEEIRLLSGVSGGSVGAAHYVSCLYYGAECPGAAHTSARLSSLSDVVYALAYRDTWRAVCNAFNLACGDRGQVLEAVWRANSGFADASPDEPLTLGRAAQRIKEGKLPAFIFNTTVLETGERVMITPLSFARPGAGAAPRADTLSTFFTGQDGALDMDLWTAARVSATFPYVSPAARASFGESCPGHVGAGGRDLSERCGYHFLDGGYHDNFGVMSSIDFLRSVLEAEYEAYGADRNAYANNPARLQRILVIQVRLSNLDTRRLPKAKSTLAAELLGPLEGVMAVSGNGAVQRNRIALDGFISAWEKAFGHQISFDTFVIQPERTVKGPLSWHLTDRDITELFDDPKANPERYAGNDIAAAWGERNSCWAQMNAFLDGVLAAIPANCGGRGETDPEVAYAAAKAN